MYSILKRTSRQPRTPVAFSPELLVPGFWAIDLETKGVDAADPACEIVGIGLANEKHCFYVDGSHGWPAGIKDFLNASTFTAFNALFDGTFLQQQFLGKWPSFVGCSYGLFKQMSGEGFNGQSWGLKVAQTEILGWPERNDKELRKWLVENGHVKRAIRKEVLAKLSGQREAQESPPMGPGQHELPSREGEDSDIQLVEEHEATVLELEGPLVLTIRRKRD